MARNRRGREGGEGVLGGDEDGGGGMGELKGDERRVRGSEGEMV